MAEKLVPMAISVAGTLVAGPAGLSMGVAKLFYDSIQEGKALRALYDCEKQ